MSFPRIDGAALASGLRVVRSGTRSHRWLRYALPIAAAAVALCQGAAAQAEPKLKVLFSFANTNGYQPYAGLVADSAGNLYGTTFGGGPGDQGEVFRLSPPLPGQTAWNQTVLLSFNRANGSGPFATLIFDKAGNLYGTTVSGGAHNAGEVFELSPPAAGQTLWTETVLYSFNSETGGYEPSGGLLLDGSGNLFGTARYGGPSDYGLVFELSPPASGQTAWTSSVLLNFNWANGANPNGALIADAAGDLYGTTVYGGAVGNGVVFELSPPSVGQTVWTETLITSFGGANGSVPWAGLVADSVGNLFGTTIYGGTTNQGTVFELSPPAAGQASWTQTELHLFDTADGSNPKAGLYQDGEGNLYGTTTAGGVHDSGALFELTPPPAGQTGWAETVLFSFKKAKGSFPSGALIADAAGNLYGTTADGGTSDQGVVFRLKP